MIGVREKVEGGAGAEAVDEGLEEIELGEFVAAPLEEEHGDLDIEEMFGAGVRGFAGRMEGKANENEAAHAGQRGLGLGLRGHAAAK